MSAVAALRKGGVIAYPTDTVYGLGADATNPKAIKKVYGIKGRDFRKPLSIAVASLSMMEKYVKLDARARRLIRSLNGKRLFPGPTTLLLKKKGLPSVLTHGSPLVGIRIPKSRICISIVKKLGRPITSTSANRSGRPSPKGWRELDREIEQKVDMVVRGKCIFRKESTIIDAVKMSIVRKGARWRDVERCWAL